MVSRQAEGFESTVWPLQNPSSGRWWNNNAETPIWVPAGQIEFAIIWHNESRLLQYLFPFLVLTAGFFLTVYFIVTLPRNLRARIWPSVRISLRLFLHKYEGTEAQSALGCDSFPFRFSNHFQQTLFPNFPFIVISKKSAPIRLPWDRLGQRYARVCFHDWVFLRL